VLVVVGLRKMSISKLVVFLVIVRSRKLISPSVSVVGFSCRLLCIVLVYGCNASGLLCEES
jgi:hypothetical protein